MIARAAAAVAAAAVAAACAGDAGADDDPDGPDAGDGADAGDDAAPCGALDVDPPWLDAAVADVVARLAGAADVAPGVRLADRATAPNRAAARAYLRDALGAAGIAADEHAYGTGANVVARLPGADPAAGWVLVGAHFDSVPDSPGANDNASGVAAVLAAARILDATCRRRGVIVAFFDQEEVGLVGATYLADALVDAGDDVVAVHTVDQVGWDDDGDRVFEIELPAPGLLAGYQAAAADLGLAVTATTTAGSDHTAFRQAGFAAVGVTEEFAGGDTTPHYHLPTDTAATVELAYTADAVRLIAAVVAAAAE